MCAGPPNCSPIFFCPHCHIFITFILNFWGPKCRWPVIVSSEPTISKNFLLFWKYFEVLIWSQIILPLSIMAFRPLNSPRWFPEQAHKQRATSIQVFKARFSYLCGTCIILWHRCALRRMIQRRCRRPHERHWCPSGPRGGRGPAPVHACGCVYDYVNVCVRTHPFLLGKLAPSHLFSAQTCQVGPA